MHHDKQDIHEVNAEGAAAARDGRSERENPYDLSDSVRFGAWLAGYISAAPQNQRPS